MKRVRVNLFFMAVLGLSILCGSAVAVNVTLSDDDLMALDWYENDWNTTATIVDRRNTLGPGVEFDIYFPGNDGLDDSVYYVSSEEGGAGSLAGIDISMYDNFDLKYTLVSVDNLSSPGAGGLLVVGALVGRIASGGRYRYRPEVIGFASGRETSAISSTPIDVERIYQIGIHAHMLTPDGWNPSGTTVTLLVEGTPGAVPLTPEPVELVGLEIVGPGEVAEDFQAQYRAIAYYDDNSTEDVTDLAAWSVQPNDYASIDSGLLETEEINKPQDVTITAVYTEGQNSEIAQKDVSILAICPSGSALDFDGDDGVYIEGSAGTGSALNIYNSDLTISAWVKPATAAAEGAIVARWKTLTGAYRLGIGSGTAYINTYLQGPGHWSISGGPVLEAGTWYHVVGVLDRGAGRGRVYVNGVEGAEGALGPNPLSNDAITRIGCRQDTSDSAFDGAIDDVRIFNRALSEEEIVANMHRRLAGDEPNLVGYWDFDEGAGQIAYDLSGNGNNGSVIGATWVESDAPVGICAIAVGLDIKPGSCPNPLNLASRGVLPVAILGTEDFDVNAIDPASIQLASVSAIRSSYEDVATPVADGNECECTTEGPDGYTDLTLKFRTQEIVEELISTPGELADGELLVLTLTGVLSDQMPIEGADCIVLVGNVPKALAAQRWDYNGDGIINILDFAELATYWLESTVY